MAKYRKAVMIEPMHGVKCRACGWYEVVPALMEDSREVANKVRDGHTCPRQAEPQARWAFPPRVEGRADRTRI